MKNAFTFTDSGRQLWRACSHPLARMDRRTYPAEAFQNESGLVDCGRRSMNQEKKLIRLQRQFVLDHAVLWNSHADESGADRAEAPHHHRALYRSYNPPDHRTDY